MIRILLCIFIPITAAFRFHLGGAITLGEILLLAATPFFVPDVHRVLQVKLVRQVLVLFFAYLFAQMFTDYVRATPIVDLVRGWARIGLMTYAFVVLAAIVGTDRRRIFAFAVGGSLSGILAVALSGDRVDLGNTTLFKFVFGGIISTLSFVVAGYGKPYLGRWAKYAPFGACLLAFAMNSRSLAGITLLAAIVPFLIRFKPHQPRVFNRRSLFTVLAVMGAAWGILFLYTTLAPAGVLGMQAKLKYQQQLAESRGQGILLGGRKELNYSWPKKIVQSPIIGWGSWAKDRTYVYGKMLEMGLSPVAALQTMTGNNGLIPSHSHLFGAWVEAGIVGALFWAFIWLMCARVLILDGFAFFGKLKPILIYAGVIFLWDIPFSPFGGERRVGNAFIIWMLVAATLAITRGNLQLRNRPKSGLEEKRTGRRVHTAV